jgi:hypothetical protein
MTDLWKHLGLGFDSRRLHQLIADVAQLVEQLICNHQVVGSTPIIGSNINSNYLY